MVVDFPGAGPSAADTGGSPDSAVDSGPVTDTAGTEDTAGLPDTDSADTRDTDTGGAADSAGDTGCPIQTWYVDSDGDGFGDAARATTACEAPPGTVAVAGDCDDTAPDALPDATESGNGLDDDCDGVVDDVYAADCVAVNGDATNDQIGEGGLLSADLDGDGTWEVLIGAPEHGSSDSGAVAVIDATWLASDVSFAVDRVVTGERSGDALGAAVVLADVYGDGIPEIVVGAPEYNGEASNAGAVYLFDSSALRGERAVDELDGVRFEGPRGSADAGSALAAGDLDGDGLDDLVVGAPGVVGGAVYVIWGDEELEGESLGDGLYYTSDDAADDLGAALLVVPDLSGDGRMDLVACGPGAEDDAGSCWILDGGEVAASSSGEDEEDERSVGDRAFARISGDAPADGVGGSSAALLGADLDGDGTDDLAVGAPGYDLDATDGGVVGVWFGGLSGDVTLADAPLRMGGDASLGLSLLADPTHTATWVGGVGDGAGAAFLLEDLVSGRLHVPDDEAARVLGDTAGDALGTTLGTFTFPSGAAGLLLAAPNRDSAATGAGTVYACPLE
jgi:hypothetical protein